MPRPHDIACLRARPMPNFRSAPDEVMPRAETATRAGADFLFLPEFWGGSRTDGPAPAPPKASEAAHPFLRGFAADRRPRWDSDSGP